MGTKIDYEILDQSLTREIDWSIDFAHDVLIGLTQSPKRLPSRYFYDDKGSVLFQKIMAEEEYYPTRCETEVLKAHARDILEATGEKSLNIIDLGAGDGKKTTIVLKAARDLGIDVHYVPIDISQAAIEIAVTAMAKELPELKVKGVVAEYMDGVRWIGKELTDRPNLLLFLGSNIGNFSLVGANDFLRKLWKSLRANDHVLVGFDLKKDIEVLLSAYNDSHGTTASFNLNMLERINRELGGEFDLSRFRHYGTYNVFSGAMESFLVSHERQTIAVKSLEREFEFDPWEPVHTEYSYKYLRTDIGTLAKNNGFVSRDRFEDKNGWFVDALFRVEKSFS